MKLYIFIFSLLLSVSALGDTSLDRIEAAAEQYAQGVLEVPEGARLLVSASELDRRRHFDSCDTPLQAQAPSTREGARYMTVKISCDTPKPWLVYVPVQIAVEYPVMVAKMTLGPDTLLDESMVALRYVNNSSLRGNYFSSPDELNGARLKRRASAGQVITRRNVCLVCKGNPVTIEANNDHLSIRTSGTAMGSGSQGDPIRVQNNRSKRMVDAYVIGIGQVRVKM
ncbi:flagellar basal body P-ring formation protein FlgA [Ferrimonas sediminicola]|uniref:Flagella basal body P-ring formation protein FlgA n=1 Tax=Ferrimonas sediminicola TaxID=2569538 RepID=A0A4U1B9C5_9GAMM|nr:flagellar basal body P-ring formation chaperone FlgA [Ferrimonas sediminicola]TKB47265.1 flagellar basal body P-ring formation protein FlgA [Ferrimonas sediminicola]